MKIVSGTAWVATATLYLVGWLPAVHSHGFLTAPKVEFFTQQEDPTAYSATIDGPKALPVPDGMHYGWGPAASTEAFTAAFGNSSFKTLREFVMKHQTMQPSAKIDPECGRTNVGAKALQPLPDQVVWQHGDNEGFTLSHEGPCEVWCDDERVFVEKNCAKKYPHIPAKMPYERAKCQGKSRLQIVWLALHDGTRWQVYMNCAPLAGAGGSTSTESVPGDSSTDSASASTSTPPVLPGTVKPSAALDDNKEQKSPAPTSTKRTSSSVIPKPPQTHAESKTPKPSTKSTKAPTGHAAPTDGSTSDGDDGNDTDDLDCDPSETTESSRKGHAISIPRWLANPLQILTAHQSVDASAKNLRSLEEKAPTSLAPRNHDHSSATLGSSSSDSASQRPGTVTSTAAQNDTVPSTQMTSEQKPSPAPTTDELTHNHWPVKTPRPLPTFKPSYPSMEPSNSKPRMTRPPIGQASRADGSSSDSDDDSSSDDVGCKKKKPFMIGVRPGNPYYPAIPPVGIFTRKPLLTLATYDYLVGRTSRKLEAASSAPAPTPLQQVIQWENGAQEVIAPHIAEKAKADFEANEKKREEWRHSIKKTFGYV